MTDSSNKSAGDEQGASPPAPLGNNPQPAKIDDPQQTVEQNRAKGQPDGEELRLLRALTTTTRSSVHSGPLPPPEILRGYDKIVPGAANRILAMAETQMQHRHKMEEKVISPDINRSYAGLVAGAVISLACVIGGVVAIFLGHDGAGATVATASVTALAGVFVYGTATRRREREVRRENAQQVMEAQQEKPAG